MNSLLNQFVAEARDFLQDIGSQLMALESDPGNANLMNELFRLVHTLKGNSGLFDVRDMTKVLHAGEDLMDAVRDGRVGYSQAMADTLLEAMDLVSEQLDEIERSGGSLGPEYAEPAAAQAEALRALLPDTDVDEDFDEAPGQAACKAPPLTVGAIPAADRLAVWGAAPFDTPLIHITYGPDSECFFKGEDPFFLARQTPGLVWAQARHPNSWGPLSELDCYRCELVFDLLARASREEVQEHFRYVPEQVDISILPLSALLSEADQLVVEGLLHAQSTALLQPDSDAWLSGRLKACAASLTGILVRLGLPTQALDDALAQALEQKSSAPLAAWLDNFETAWRSRADVATTQIPKTTGNAVATALRDDLDVPAPANGSSADETRNRRNEEGQAGKILKVDQVKVDRLMDLIGEMVVAKNSLPYLAKRAEDDFGNRELSREIKAQYAVINRIAEEMQDAIMQVRMMPVSFVFQRFPRLVRDISRKLGKTVDLVLEGEDTEADKNIIEALAEPLIHIVRNSLDHGLETSDVRVAAGKPAAGRLLIRARQEADRVLIEVIDDGKGIDPAVIKRKAYEKGVIDELQLDKLSDQEAINLVFAAGFSTADEVSDLSGRGVGMDAVKTAIEKVGGSIQLSSVTGEGTTLRLGLPLSMAVTNVMIVESDGQIFGLPMELVVETVRLPSSDINTIKRQRAAVLRGRVVPLVPLNELLAIPVEPQMNEDGELAAVIVRVGGDQVGLLVDGFREVVDILLKPLPGELAKLSYYAGTALLGDGSVLMVLNPKELF